MGDVDDKDGYDPLGGRYDMVNLAHFGETFWLKYINLAAVGDVVDDKVDMARFGDVIV